MTKRILKTMTLLTLVVAILTVVGYVDTHYTRKDCTVIAIEEDNLVVVEDTCGYTWTYYADDEVPRVEDTVTLKMHTNHTTDYVGDDEEIDVR
jgi:hypothetical protein